MTKISQQLDAPTSSASQTVSCPICHAAAVSVERVLYDDRYGYPGYFRLFRCSGCSHGFLENAFNSDDLEDLYSNYYPRRSLKLEDHRPHSERTGFGAWVDGERRSAFRWVPPRVRVLDIGCGFGESLGYHVARGCDAHGVEADSNIRRVADRFGYNVHVGLFDATMYEPESFDYVTMDQVIEHVVDPVATLVDVRTVLKPGGHLILSTPNFNGWGPKVFGNRWIHWHTPYHLQLFTRRSMARAAAAAGFRLQTSKTITSSEWLGHQFWHLLERPEIGRPSGYWANSRPGGRRVEQRVVSYLNRLKLNHVVTRLFDALSVGDGCVFVLTRVD